MLIADNQAKTIHERSASGKDRKTPTEYFLRAPDPNSLMFAESALPAASNAGTGIGKILQIGKESAMMRYQWNNRGRAPVGYIKGMALAYARVYCKLKVNDPSALEMAKPIGDDDLDALAWLLAPVRKGAKMAGYKRGHVGRWA